MADADAGAQWADAQIAQKPEIRSPLEYREVVEKLWRDGLPPGAKTGWPSVDKHYTIAPGQLSIITGWPGAGKSTWLDALMVNLCRQGWRFAVFSAENMPVEIHIAKLMAQFSGVPFGEGKTKRIPQDEIGEWLDEMSRSIKFITQKSDAPSMREIHKLAFEWLAESDAPRGMIVDPWNQVDQFRPAGMSETEFIRDTLNMTRNWARATNTHVWIVAHPQKMPRDKGILPVPRADMISGSMHWWNVADAAISVWRDPEKPDSHAVDIVVQKIRFSHIGVPGTVTLDFNRATGRYSEPRGNHLYEVASGGD